MMRVSPLVCAVRSVESRASRAFIAGLLHKFETVVLLHIDSAGVSELPAAHRNGDTRDLAILEAELTAIGHEECGAILVEERCLPKPLVSAVTTTAPSARVRTHTPLPG